MLSIKIIFYDAAAHFKEVGCEVIACSVDSHFTHDPWPTWMEYTKKARSDGGIGEMDIPILSDLTKTLIWQSI